MFSYYLFEQAYHGIGIEALQANLIRLNEVLALKDEQDHFFKSDQLWKEMIDKNLDFLTCIYQELPDKQFMRNVLPRLLGQIGSSGLIANKTDFDKAYSTMNAFWGETFKRKERYCISSKNDYLEFRRRSLLSNINYRNFWEWKDILFKNIKFCESVKEQMKLLGDSDFFNQMIDRLVALDMFNASWTNGACTADRINHTVNLRVSNESDSVRNDVRKRQYRMFQLPCKGEAKFFDLHIKTGDFRIHFYPVESEYTIYIGYIGSHLPL